MSITDIEDYYKFIIDIYTNEEIKKYKKCYVMLIKDILECGIDKDDFDTIIFLINSIIYIRSNDKDNIKNKGYININNKDLINILLHNYNNDNNKRLNKKK